MQANHQTLIMSAWMHKALLFCLFGKWAKAESEFQDMMQLSDEFSLGLALCHTPYLGDWRCFYYSSKLGNASILGLQRNVKILSGKTK
jgi:hypothetical protein